MTQLHTLPMFDEVPLALPQHPSRIIVSISGGKDSVAALLAALEMFGPEPVIAHHQVILQDWPGTVEYCQRVCDVLGVPLYLAQGSYSGLQCLACGKRQLSLRPETAYCHTCGARCLQFVQMVESIHDLIEWRGKWVSSAVRACTGYFKRDVWNRWARQHAVLLGPTPLLVTGERHRESASRSRLPLLSYRSGLKAGWILEWRPILQYRRIDAFRAMRSYGIKPHYCYKVQWRELLRGEHIRWCKQGISPHQSYAEQWEHLAQKMFLSEPDLDSMIDQLMYEVDEEGGPRCSCVDCFFKPIEHLKASYQTSEGRAIMEDAMQIEETIGFTMKYQQSLKSIVI